MLESLRYHINNLRILYHEIESMALSINITDVSYHETRIRELAGANIVLAKRLGKNTKKLEKRIEETLNFSAAEY